MILAFVADSFKPLPCSWARKQSTLSECCGLSTCTSLSWLVNSIMVTPVKLPMYAGYGDFDWIEKCSNLLQSEYNNVGKKAFCSLGATCFSCLCNNPSNKFFFNEMTSPQEATPYTYHVIVIDYLIDHPGNFSTQLKKGDAPRCIMWFFCYASNNGVVHQTNNVVFSFMKSRTDSMCRTSSNSLWLLRYQCNKMGLFRTRNF